MQGLIADTGEPWPKDFNWATPAIDLSAALRDTTLLGIVQVHSAVDDMLGGLRADLDSWQQLAGAEPIVVSLAEDVTDPLEEFHMTALGGGATDHDRLRGVLRYFRLARNCIVHRSSLASPALAAVSRDGSVHASLAAWPTRKGTPLPALPRFDADQSIELLPRHAILCLQAAYESAVIVNRRVIRALGAPGLAYLTARHVLFDDAPLDGLTAYRSAQAVVSDAMSNRYRLTTRGGDVIHLLKPLGVWPACLDAFRQRYGDPPQPLPVTVRPPGVGRPSRRGC